MLMFHVKHFEQLVKNNREVPALSIHTDEQQPRSAPRPTDPPALCDYEGSAYRVEFWTDARAFEDLAERRALHTLLPPRGARLIEIGAGFGRLADLYAGYSQVILVEPALSMLRQAQEHPDAYRDIIVRVAGFSAFFVELGKPVQDQIIARTEHEL